MCLPAVHLHGAKQSLFNRPTRIYRVAAREAMSEQTQSWTSDDLASQQLVIYAKELQQLYQENKRLRQELQLQGPRVVGPGSRIGRYEVREEIGRGATAVVFKAYDPDLSREVAAKVLHWHLNDDPSFTERFRREAKSGGYVNRCVNDIRRRPSQPLSQRRSHPRIERRDRRLRSTQGPSDA